MRTNAVFEDKRLLEALDLIDQDYISETMEYYDDLPEVAGKTHRSKRATRRLVGQVAALAACLMLMSAAIPTVSYVIQRFAAGSPYEYDLTYPMFVDDLEPLSDAEMLDINEAYEDWKYERLCERYSSVANADEFARNELGDSVHRFFNKEKYDRYQYYGKFGDCVVLATENFYYVATSAWVAGYEFKLDGTADLIVYRDGEIMTLSKAYEAGFMSDAQVGAAYERYLSYQAYLNGQEDSSIEIPELSIEFPEFTLPEINISDIPNIDISDTPQPDISDVPAELKIKYSQEGMLTEAEARRIVWDYIKDNGEENKLDSTYRITCHAKSNGVYAVMISGPWAYTQAVRHVDVAGYTFLFPDGKRMYIYKDGAFYTLNEAYSAGVADKEFFVSIQWYKTK